MAESILVTGKKISSMELVTNVTGNEKIPTGQPNDLAVTPNQIADHTIARGDLASQEDLSQVEGVLTGQIQDLTDSVESQNNSIRSLVSNETAQRISADNSLSDRIEAEAQSRSTKDSEIIDELSQTKASINSQLKALRTELTEETDARIRVDNLKVDKVGSVESVSGRTGKVVITPEDIGYPTLTEMDSRDKSAIYVKDSNGQTQQQVNDSLRQVTSNLQSEKATKSNTLAGYGILDAYTKLETDAVISSYVGGRKAYPTLADAVADQVNLQPNTTVEILRDANSSSNGLYLWDGTNLLKSFYDPTTQMKNYVDSNPLFKPSVVSEVNARPVDTYVESGIYLVASTQAAQILGVPAIGGGALVVYTQGNMTYQRWSLYNSSREFVRYSNVSGVFPAWVEVANTSQIDQAVAPLPKWSEINSNPLYAPETVTTANAKPLAQYTKSGWYLVTTTSAATTMGLPEAGAGVLFVMFIGGTIHQKWAPYASTREYIRTSSVTGIFPDWDVVVTKKVVDAQFSDFLSSFDFRNAVSDYSVKPYDIVTESKNLYDPLRKQVGKYVSVEGLLREAEGWSTTEFIPVTAGEYITISFGTKRVGAATYADKDSASTVTGGYFASSANPLTIQIPAGMNYLVVNIDSNTVTGSNVQIERGQTATQYQPFGKTYRIDPSYISGGAQTNSSRLVVDGMSATIVGSVDGEPISLDVLTARPQSHSQASVFNFVRDYVGGVLQRNLGDDVAPMRMGGATIGANHGYQKSDVTLSAHGKTEADIGSVWLSDGKEYVIVDVPSANVLSVTSRSDNSAYQLGQLTHVSGAVNTTSFTPTSTVSNQWYPAIRDREIICLVDGVEIDLNTNGTYAYSKDLKFLETYSIMLKGDIVEWVISNRGSNLFNYDAAPAYTVDFAYTFDTECGCTIYFGGVGRKTFALADQMITQSVQLAQGNGVVYNYIPKSIEFTAGGFTYNFSELENLYAKNPSVPLYINAEKQESGVNAIDRVVMLNSQVGYATGYLPTLDAHPTVRPENASNKFIEIRNGSLKLYPRLIDSSTINQVKEGDAFAAIAYRKYFKRSSQRTCNYVVRSEVGDYWYLDWHTAKLDQVQVPKDLLGRPFEVVEKSSNVSLLSRFASNHIMVEINDTKSYGYLVLKFSK